MIHKTKEKNEASYTSFVIGTGRDMLCLVRGDSISKKVAKIAEEKRFLGIIIWFSRKEALSQHTSLPKAFIGDECHGPRTIIDAIKAYK